MNLSTRIKLLFGSTKCEVRGYHECAKGDWQPIKEYGKGFFELKCDGCSKTLVSVIRDPSKPISRIVLTRWWGDEYTAEMYEESLTATAGKTVTCSSAGHTWTATMAPVALKIPANKKRGKNANRKRA